MQTKTAFPLLEGKTYQLSFFLPGGVAEAITITVGAFLSLASAGSRNSTKQDPVGTPMTATGRLLARLATQAAAQDALKLSREISAMYVDSVKDHGVVMRLFSLPASLVIDAAKGNFVSGERERAQRELAAKMDEIDKRLKEVQSLAAASN